MGGQGRTGAAPRVIGRESFMYKSGQTGGNPNPHAKSAKRYHWWDPPLSQKRAWHVRQ